MFVVLLKKDRNRESVWSRLVIVIQYFVVRVEEVAVLFMVIFMVISNNHNGCDVRRSCCRDS